MADFVARLFRTVFMLALGVLVGSLVLCLLLATLAWVLGHWLWGALTGRRVTAREQWGHFQRSAASTVWQRYRQSASATATARRPAAGTDVVDVDFRDVAAPSSAPDRLGR